MRLRVTDNDVGIAPEVRPFLFEPLFTTRTPGDGTGLGLATVHGIVHQSQGWIDVGSELGRGSTFEIHFPAAAGRGIGEALQTVLAARPRDVEPAGGRTGRIRSIVATKVLIVDDEDSVRQFVERVLRDAGYETIVASDGSDAIAQAKELGSFDLLVTDVMMPKMTGDELARLLRREEPKLKVLYLTGYAERLFKEKVMLWEDEAYLDKPCSIKGCARPCRWCCREAWARGTLKCEV